MCVYGSLSAETCQGRGQAVASGEELAWSLSSLFLAGSCRVTRAHPNIRPEDLKSSWAQICRPECLLAPQIIQPSANSLRWVLPRGGSPGGSSGEGPTCQRRRLKRLGFVPWVGEIPWRRERLPTPAFWPGGSHGQRSLAGYGPRGRKESDRTEWLALSPDLTQVRVWNPGFCLVSGLCQRDSTYFSP